MCKFCLDKPKYGGPGKKKQCCIKRCCLAMKADMVSLPSPKRKETGKGRKQGAVSWPDVSVFFFSGLITEDDIRSPTSLITSPVITLPDYLHQSGRKLHPVKGDGNCMFRSLSNHLLGDEEEHDAQKWAYTKSSYFEDVPTLHLGNTNWNWSCSGLVSGPCLWMRTIPGWWNIPLGSASSQGTSWPVSPSNYCWRWSSLFCSHSSSLWACLQEELSLWLHRTVTMTA